MTGRLYRTPKYKGIAVGDTIRRKGEYGTFRVDSIVGNDRSGSIWYGCYGGTEADKKFRAFSVGEVRIAKEPVRKGTIRGKRERNNSIRH